MGYSKTQIVTGAHYGHLTVTGIAGRLRKDRRGYSCLCECGGVTVVEGYRLVSGRVIDCGLNCKLRPSVARRKPKPAVKQRPVTVQPPVVVRISDVSRAAYDALAPDIKKAVDGKIKAHRIACARLGVTPEPMDNFLRDAIDLAKREARHPEAVSISISQEPERRYRVYESPREL